VRALQDFEIEIPRNEFLCLLGPSGCGKSSFLRIVTGLMKPIEGEVRLNGRRIEEPGLDRGIVFQEPALFPWLTALRNVAFGLEMSGMNKHAVNERAAKVLRIVGLEGAMHLYPYQLSGGMRHRVAVARAWALTGASLLLFANSLSAFATIEAWENQIPYVVPQSISGSLISEVGLANAHEGDALALGMIVVVIFVMTGYFLLQRRAARWQR